MFSVRAITLLKQLRITRHLCTGNSFLDVTVDQEGIAVIKFNRRPVNSINLGVIQELHTALDLAQENDYKAVIFTSALPKIFSAGMDLFEFHKAEENKLRLFWTAVQDLFLMLYRSAYISTVAINGYTGAGACVISQMCDHRVMVKDNKAQIGLNDTTVGIVPADWVRELMIRPMGLKHAEAAITASTMFTPDEALKVNLVDELAVHQKDAIEKCKQYIRKFDHIPVRARVEAKKRMRGNLLKYVEENRRQDLEAVLKNILDPEIQKNIATYVDRLKQRKNK